MLNGGKKYLSYQSPIFLALVSLVGRTGGGFGVTATGWLFHRFGPRTTFISYTISTSIVLALFLGYISSRNTLDKYEKVADTVDEDTDEE